MKKLGTCLGVLLLMQCMATLDYGQGQSKRVEGERVGRATLTLSTGKLVRSDGHTTWGMVTRVGGVTRFQVPRDRTGGSPATVNQVDRPEPNAVSGPVRPMLLSLRRQVDGVKINAQRRLHSMANRVKEWPGVIRSEVLSRWSSTQAQER